MISHARTTACLAAAVAIGAMASATSVTAQTSPNPYVIPYQQGGLNPFTLRRNLTLAIPATTNNPNQPAVTMGPSRGPIGSRIQVQVNRNLGATPAILSFKAVVSRGVPARIHTRIFGSGNSYGTSAPIQLCIQGGGTWEAELVLSNGRNVGTIGSFTPTNCPR